MVTVCLSPTLNSQHLDLNSPEQSQHVYENKGRSLEHGTSRSPDADNMSIYPFVSRR
jgi:hypothetical protein